MCLQPIKILNRSRRFRVGVDSPVLQVPCGHCEQCQQRKMSDWFVRAVFERERCLKSGGFVWFPTLSYNNSNLVRWSDNEFQDGFSIPVFDKSHFVSFRTKLRVYLKRLGYNCSGENTIRYLYCCEYGDKKGRSHLHCLLFVPFDIDRDLFKRLVRKSWIYGFVMYSKKYGCEVSSNKGINYVMKYMHKQQVWFDKYHIDDYLNFLKSNAIEGNDLLIRNYYSAKLRAFRRCLPHHCQSMGFGSSYNPTDMEFIEDKILASKLNIYDKNFVYNVPIYYKRRFLYNYDKITKLFTLNERGLDIKRRSYNIFIDNLDKYYAQVFYDTRLLGLLETDDFKFLKHSKYYDSFIKCRDYDSRDIAIYSVVYRSVNIKSRNLVDTFNSSGVDFFLSQQRKNGFFNYCNRLYLRDIIPSDSMDISIPKYCLDYISYSDVNIYKVFEDALMFVECLEKELGKRSQNALLKKFLNESIQFGSFYNYVSS